MSQTLTIEVRDDVYQAIRDAAERSGKTPDEVGADWLEAAVRRVMDDPLFALAGSIKSDVPDWADRHDSYIGQALAKQLDSVAGGRDGGS